MKRILFVDDESAILEGLRNVFRRERRHWDMAFAERGEAALAMLAERPFDVIVSDIRMPGMNGLELLERVRQEHPGVVRIALTGYADRDLVAEASAVTHQQLAKPCEPEALRSVLQRACAFRDFLANDDLRRVVGALGGLPSVPSSYQALSQAIADPGVSMKRLADIVGRDVGVASRVLKFVNSAYFGLSKKTGSLEEAIVCIGLNALRHMVLTIEVFGAIPAGVPEYSPSDLEAHAVLTARVARRMVPARHAELAFAAGLLHDVGKLVLVTRLPDACRDAAARARREGRPLHVAEKEVVGADHAELGAYLLGLWGLPAGVIEAVGRHHAPLPPDVPPDDLVAAVAVAHELAHEALPGPGGEAARHGAGGTENALLDSARPQLPAWRQLASEEALHLRAA